MWWDPMVVRMAPLAHRFQVTRHIFAKVGLEDPEDAENSFTIGVLCAHVRR